MNNPVTYRTLCWALFACLATATVVAAQNLIILDAEDDSAEIAFDEPLVSDDPALSGQTLAALADGFPLFPPIEGLPDEVWKDRSCSGCHKWDRATLCTQAQFYLSDAGQAGLKKQHPYGGGFKQALRSWGTQGCE